MVKVNRLLKALLTPLALVALCSVTPDTARAQACQTCATILETQEVCIFCPAGPTCYEDCRHDPLGNCYVTGANCPGSPKGGGTIPLASFFEGAQPREAFRLAGGTVLPVSEEVSLHVNCSGEILGVLEESVAGGRYVERDNVDPKWVRREEARLWMVTWLL